MPDDSLIPGKKAQEIPLNGSVVSTVDVSPPPATIARTPVRCLSTFEGGRGIVGPRFPPATRADYKQSR